MRYYNASLQGLGSHRLQRLCRSLPRTCWTSTSPLGRVTGHVHLARFVAALRGTPGGSGGTSGKRLTRQGGDDKEGMEGGGGGGGASSASPGEPIILRPLEDTNSSKRAPNAPLRRSSYRRTKAEAEERRRQRAEFQAQLAAASKRARVSYISSSSSSPAVGGVLRVALVDGYNVIHASAELRRLADFSLQDARYALNRMAVAYAATYAIRVYVVYDAMGSRRDSNSLERLSAQAVAVFSAASEADTYISKAAQQLKRRGAQQVMVVSNDRYVQDNAIDQDYVIYPVQLDTWLDQAHLAMTSGRSAAAFAASSAAAASIGAAGAAAPALPRPTLDRLSPAVSISANRDEEDNDGNDDGGGQGSERAVRHDKILPDSGELQAELVRLASSDDDDNEFDDDDGMYDNDDEEEESDYWAKVQDYCLHGWSSDEEGQEGLGREDAEKESDQVNRVHDGSPSSPSSSTTTIFSDSRIVDQEESSGASVTVRYGGSNDEEEFRDLNHSAGSTPQADPWVGLGCREEQGLRDTATSSGLASSAACGSAGSACVASGPDKTATDNTVLAVHAATAAAAMVNGTETTVARAVEMEQTPMSATGIGTTADTFSVVVQPPHNTALGAAPTPSPAVVPESPKKAEDATPLSPPPPDTASTASAPRPSLSGLLGKGGRARLAGLVKRATSDFE